MLATNKKSKFKNALVGRAAMLLAIVMSIVFMSANLFAVSALTVTPMTTAANGENVLLSLSFSGDTDLVSGTIVIGYDSSQLKYVSASVDNTKLSLISNTDGSVVFNISELGGGITSGSLGYIYFEVLSDAGTQCMVSVSGYDCYSSSGDRVTVNSNTAVVIVEGTDDTGNDGVDVSDDVVDLDEDDDVVIDDEQEVTQATTTATQATTTTGATTTTRATTTTKATVTTQATTTTPATTTMVETTAEPIVTIVTTVSENTVIFDDTMEPEATDTEEIVSADSSAFDLDSYIAAYEEQEDNTEDSGRANSRTIAAALIILVVCLCVVVFIEIMRRH